MLNPCLALFVAANVYYLNILNEPTIHIFIFFSRYEIEGGTCSKITQLAKVAHNYNPT